MKTYKSTLKSAAVLAGAALVPTSVVFMSSVLSDAIAATKTQDINIKANVPANCTFPGGTANDLDFGTYDPITTNATADLDSSSTFKIQCTKGTTVALSMDDGDNSSGAQRRMVAGTSATTFLEYQLYTTSGRTTIWNATNTVSPDFSSSGAPITETVYGRVPGAASQTGGATLIADDYSDIVTITATFS